MLETKDTFDPLVMSLILQQLRGRFDSLKIRGSRIRCKIKIRHAKDNIFFKPSCHLEFNGTFNFEILCCLENLIKQNSVSFPAEFSPPF